MSHPMSGPYTRDPAADAILAFHQQNKWGRPANKVYRVQKLDIMAQGEQQEYCVVWNDIHDNLAIQILHLPMYKSQF
jgi:hypothetical protein